MADQIASQLAPSPSSAHVIARAQARAPVDFLEYWKTGARELDHISRPFAWGLVGRLLPPTG